MRKLSVSALALSNDAFVVRMSWSLRLASLHQNVVQTSAMSSSLRLCLRITENLIILVYERREGLFKRLGTRRHGLRSCRSLRKPMSGDCMAAREICYCSLHWRVVLTVVLRIKAPLRCCFFFSSTHPIPKKRFIKKTV